MAVGRVVSASAEFTRHQVASDQPRHSENYPTYGSDMIVYVWIPDIPMQSGFRDDVFWRAQRPALLDTGY